CGVANSLLGSFSATAGRAPTQKVRISLMPLAVRTRTACSPRAQSAATFTVALTAPADGSRLGTLNPGEEKMMSLASASRPPPKVRTTSVPRCTPRGETPPREGEAAKEDSPQRHRDTEKKTENVNNLRFIILTSWVPSLGLVFSVSLCLCGEIYINPRVP